MSRKNNNGESKKTITYKRFFATGLALNDDLEDLAIVVFNPALEKVSSLKWRLALALKEKIRERKGRRGRTLLYVKRITFEDFRCISLNIPLEYLRIVFALRDKVSITGQLFLPVLDPNGKLWHMEVRFRRFNPRFPAALDWHSFIKEHQLEPDDFIFLYCDYDSGLYLIEYERWEKAESRS